MLPRVAYLEFAAKWFGKIKLDLATSGLRPIMAAELGGVDPSDVTSRQKFQRALADRYDVPVDEIFPCLGASGALFVAYASLLDRGDRVLVEAPGYEPMWRVPEALGARVDRFERRLDESYALDVSRVLDDVTRETRVVAISNPHNPTATVLDDAVLRTLADALPPDTYLLVDEAYREAVRPAHTSRSLAPNIVTCSSTTKCWGVPWPRAGWVHLPAEKISAAARAETHSVGVAPPGSWAWGAVAVAKADELRERAREIQGEKRARVDEFMRTHSKIRWLPPHENSLYGWVVDARGRSLTPFIERGIESHGVIVSPGEFFGEPSAFRMSWTTDEASLEQGLVALSKVLDL